jgi:hypothetical protein
MEGGPQSEREDKNSHSKTSFLLFVEEEEPHPFGQTPKLSTLTQSVVTILPQTSAKFAKYSKVLKSKKAYQPVVNLFGNVINKVKQTANLSPKKTTKLSSDNSSAEPSWKELEVFFNTGMKHHNYSVCISQENLAEIPPIVIGAFEQHVNNAPRTWIKIELVVKSGIEGNFFMCFIM